ncbi:MAG: right-handed parallel beta-helix repeat-containing protein [Candidatus Latescibacterota bacterium]|nr:MAG: right-handed parallel beta-helix repeat-containing protein [Candidatus Latescibacterota bacterium]
MKRVDIMRCGTLIIFFAVVAQAAWCQAEEIHVSDAAQLQELLSQPLADVTIRLAPGTYELTPQSAVDSTCGNCEDPATEVPITVGVRISGRNVVLQGPELGEALIVTHAGYGLYVKDCMDCRIEGLVITGGERDPDGNATDAAIVAKYSTLDIVNNRILDNIGDSTTVNTTVVGIMGICGREGAKLTIEGNEIIRNSWDGIALYRRASATIVRNVIDGVDKARGKQVGGGRGVGIGVTWNATAEIGGNIVKRYWKGIGVFVDAWASVRGNVVEDIITWGVTLWDADKGTPLGVFEDNVIYNTGACGASITRSKPLDPDIDGRFVRNVFVKTAQNPKYDDPEYYCFQTSLALHAVPERFEIADNLFYDNRRATDDLADFDVARDEFMKSIDNVCKRIARSPLLSKTDFARDYCGVGKKQ